MENLIKDARFAVRTLRRQPGFAITAVVTLALAIGASTAIFSVVEAALLRALPFAEPQRLAFLWGVAGPQKAIRGASYIEAQDWRRLTRAFDGVAIYDETSLNLRTAEGTERVEAEMVSASYWTMLGVNAQLGRTFTEDEDRTPNTHPVVTISHQMWTTRFGGSAAIVGTSLTLNERPFTVVGVMPRDFRGISFDTDVWFPAAMVQASGGPTNLEDRGNRWLGVVGRMRPDVRIAVAQADADRVAAQLTKDYPESNSDRGIQVQPLREAYLGTTERVLWSVFGAAGLLLLIACANVLGLQLVRAASRGREIALRLAIGADRKRLVQQLIVEGMVLAAVSAVVGVILAHWVLQGLLALAPDGLLPGYAQPAINVTALAFVLAITLGCGVVFGLVPALHSSRVQLGLSLREGSRGSAMGVAKRFGGQQLLVIGETAVALVLLIGAGLFMRSLQRELAVRPGFDARDVLRARVVFPLEYDAPRRMQVAQQLQERLATLPSVRSVAVGSDLPLAGGVTSAAFISIRESSQRVRYYRHSALPGFTEGLGMRIVKGRAFTADDRIGAPAVVLINESAAIRFWPDGNVLGKEIRLGSDSGAVVTVVGVVADVRYRDLTTPLGSTEPDVFFPFAQRATGEVQVALRSTLPPENLAAALRREVAAIDPAMSVFGVRPLEELLGQQTATERFASSLLGVFGACALVLTAVGLYGVLAFVVGLRSREIGIRMALGATRARVLRSVMGQGLVLVAAGVVVGVAVASGVTRYVASLLFGVDAHDTLVFVFVPALLLLVALVASWLPARRAAALDPQMSLRSE